LYQYWSEGAGVRDATGNYIVPWNTPEVQAAQYTVYEINALKAYKADALTWADLAQPAKPSPYGFVWSLTLPADSEGAVAENRVINEIRIKEVPKIVMSKTDSIFEIKWAEFVKQCKDAGISKRENEINTALKLRIQLWGTAK
jgi:hypothetical protein